MVEEMIMPDQDQSKGPITANTILTVDQFTGKVGQPEVDL